MEDKGFLKKIKQKWMAFLQKKKEQKEKKKKEALELRLWQKQNNVKHYSKIGLIFYTALGLFVGLFEAKADSKSKINLQRPSDEKKCIEDQKTLIKIAAYTEEIENKIVTEKKIEMIEFYQSELKKQKQAVTEIVEKYPPLPRRENVCLKVAKEASIAVAQASEIIQKIDTVARTATDKKEEIIQYKKEEIYKKIELVKEKEEKKIKDVHFIPLSHEKRVTKQELEATQILPTSSTVLKEDDLTEKKDKEEQPVLVSTVLLPIPHPVVDKTIYQMDVKKLEEKIKNTEDPIYIKECIEKLEVLESKEHSEETVKIIKEAQNKAEEIIRKEKIKWRSEDDLAEILYMETLIYSNLKKQKKEVKRFKKKIDSLQVHQKKLGFLGGIKQFLSGSIQLAFSLFPLTLFRNKKIGLLTSAILVNNSIRSMRSAIKKVDIPYVEYENIAKRIRDNEVETENTKLICYDSLEQIAALKEEFLREVGYEESKEVDSVLKEMNQLEKMIESRTMELEKVSDSLSTTKEANRQKIKRMEDFYSRP